MGEPPFAGVQGVWLYVCPCGGGHTCTQIRPSQQLHNLFRTGGGVLWREQQPALSVAQQVRVSEPEDNFLRTDFNTDFAKIDTAIKQVEHTAAVRSDQIDSVCFEQQYHLDD